MPSVNRCCVFKCMMKSSSGEKLKFHRFPRDVLLCRKWLQATGNEELTYLPASFLTNSRFICSTHFEATCYKDGSSSLKRGSIPTIFHPDVTPLSEEKVAVYPLKEPSAKNSSIVDHRKGHQSESSTEQPPPLNPTIVALDCSVIGRPDSVIIVDAKEKKTMFCVIQTG